MFTLSAFADEIDPNPQRQIDVLKQCGIRHIELRSILKTNVLDLTDLQVAELKSLLDQHGFKLSAIGSPIGKIPIDQPFEPHLARFKRALELCKVFGTPNMRMFSYYLTEHGEWDDWRREVLDRMWEKAKLAEKAGVRLLHENEHRIYGDDPERVKDLMETVNEQLSGPSFAAVYDPATGQPTRVRIRFTDSAGGYYPPLGRLPEAKFHPPLFEGNTLIDGKGYAYIDGTCEINLPPGQLRVEAHKGPEYTPLVQDVS